MSKCVKMSKWVNEMSKWVKLNEQMGKQNEHKMLKCVKIMKYLLVHGKLAPV